jgi:hypothetical protein
MPRLNIERQQQLEPERIRYAVEQLTAMGFEITSRNGRAITFVYNDSTVTYFPYSGWHTGKTITDGNDWGVVAIRTWVDSGEDSGWLWAQCYGMPYWNCVSNQWDCSDAEIDDLTVTHWHALPEMVEVDL